MNDPFSQPTNAPEPEDLQKALWRRIWGWLHRHPRLTVPTLVVALAVGLFFKGPAGPRGWVDWYRLERSGSSQALSNGPDPCTRPTQPNSLAIVGNERADHITLTTNSFREAIKPFIGSGRVVVKYGSPHGDKQGTETNRQAFQAACTELGGAPSVFVTVGTAVSQYAKLTYPQVPKFFVAVSFPVESELVTADQLDSRDSNIAGFNAGVRKERIVEVFASCFPGVALGFMYDPRVNQDGILRDYLIDDQDRVKFEPVPVTSENLVIPDDIAKEAKLIFGWNFINTHMGEIGAANGERRFIGPFAENLWGATGVVAAYSTDYSRLGSKAAEALGIGFFRQGQPLGNLPVQMEDNATLRIRVRDIQSLNIRIGSKCQYVPLL